MSRPATAILSSANLLHNLAVIKTKVQTAKIMAVVKANAYGHGIRSVGLKLDGKADALGVASIDEALILRKVGVNADIILLQGVYESEELVTAANYNLEVVFNNTNQLDFLEATKLPQPLKAWLKINTGLGRLGFSMEYAKTAYQRLRRHPNILAPMTLMSHFSVADNKAHPLNAQQMERFDKIKAQFPGKYSLCNSAGLLNFPDYHLDYVRPGILTYGISPISGISAQTLGLKPVMTIHSQLISVQKHKKGACIGYGARYQCPKNMLVGIVAFGYGDGYPFTAKDHTPVLVNNQYCSLIGRVSMDMLAVDLTACPEAQIGDKVILWGEGLAVETMVAHTSDIVWNIVTGMQNRVKCVWE